MLKPVRRAVLAMLSDIKIKHRQSAMTKTSEQSQTIETGRSEKQKESDENDSNEEILESSQSSDGSELTSEAKKEKMPRAGTNKQNESEDSDDSFSFSEDLSATLRADFFFLASDAKSDPFEDCDDSEISSFESFPSDSFRLSLRPVSLD